MKAIVTTNELQVKILNAKFEKFIYSHETTFLDTVNNLAGVTIVVILMRYVYRTTTIKIMYRSCLVLSPHRIRGIRWRQIEFRD